MEKQGHREQGETKPTGSDDRVMGSDATGGASRKRSLPSHYPNHQPHLQRVTGRAFWALGKQSKAIRKFEKAIKLAKSKGMDFQRAKSLLDLAAVKEEGRGENRAEAIELLKNMESVIPYAESRLLGDQYDEAVVAPKFDLEAWEQEHGSVRMERPKDK